MLCRVAAGYFPNSLPHTTMTGHYYLIYLYVYFLGYIQKDLKTCFYMICSCLNLIGMFEVMASGAFEWAEKAQNSLELPPKYFFFLVQYEAKLHIYFGT